MTTPNVDASPAPQPRQLRFEEYVLDLDRGCLVLNGKEIALRPKTFAVLRHLVEKYGRLVSSDELFAAAWPNVVVTNDALVQSIGELRRAFGKDGPRLIKTVPRRGYRFEADVFTAPPVDRPPSAPVSTSVLPSANFALPGTIRARVGVIASLTAAVLLLLAGMWYGISTNWMFFLNADIKADQSQAIGPGPEMHGKPAIAILPFANQSNDPNRDYFVDGLTLDIINALGRFPDLTVMSWNAVFRYKGKPEIPGQVARDLAVDYQVEGSVIHTGERVRVIAHLVSAEGRVLWSARFDEALSDLFLVQNRITAEIAGALAIRLTQIEQQRVLTKPTESLRAHDYVLRASPALQRPTRASNAEARALLRRAVEVDPSYAAAYAALAETYYSAVSMGWAESPIEFLKRAEELANKALALDDSEVRAHIVLGRVHLFHKRYEQAQTELDRAVTINPNDANALAGRGNILMWLGQTSGAIEVLERAQRIDPEMNAMDRFALSLAYYLARRYDASIEQAQVNLRKTDDAHFSRVVLAAALAQQNRREDAAGAAAIVRRMDPTMDIQTFGSKFLHAADLEHLREGLHKAGLLPLGNAR